MIRSWFEWANALPSSVAIRESIYGWPYLLTYQTVAAWDMNPRPPMGARLAGAFSLALWAGVIVFGRFTAYNWLD